MDRLGWTAGLSFKAYGTRFGIRVNDPQALEQVRQHLPFGWESFPSAEVEFLYSLRVGQPSRRKGQRNYHLLYAGSNRIARSMDLAEVLRDFAAHLELLTAYLAKDCLFVHAGAVGWQGQAIVIPGRSFSGKSTLVKALLEAGATYYSDEFTILDRQGHVHPYPVPLSIRGENGQITQKIAVETIGGRIGAEPLPVGLVVITKYQPQARWRPRQVSPARAILALMDNTVAARRGPEVSMPILKEVVTQAKIVKSKRGEATEMVIPLLHLINSN